uniref:hypothetical protein n=1 Tax=Caulobacter hibisci TaxID=2035993 RepID=UPI0038CBF472
MLHQQPGGLRGLLAMARDVEPADARQHALQPRGVGGDLAIDAGLDHGLQGLALRTVEIAAVAHQPLVEVYAGEQVPGVGVGRGVAVLHPAAVGRSGGGAQGGDLGLAPGEGCVQASRPRGVVGGRGAGSCQTQAGQVIGGGDVQRPGQGLGLPGLQPRGEGFGRVAGPNTPRIGQRHRQGQHCRRRPSDHRRPRPNEIHNDGSQKKLATVGALKARSCFPDIVSG